MPIWTRRARRARRSCFRRGRFREGTSRWRVELRFCPLRRFANWPGLRRREPERSRSPRLPRSERRRRRPGESSARRDRLGWRGADRCRERGRLVVIQAPGPARAAPGSGVQCCLYGGAGRRPGCPAEPACWATGIAVAATDARAPALSERECGALALHLALHTGRDSLLAAPGRCQRERRHHDRRPDGARRDFHFGDQGRFAARDRARGSGGHGGLEDETGGRPVLRGARRASAGLSRALAAGASGAFRNGGRRRGRVPISVRVKLPDTPGAVWADYFIPDGTVIHLEPRPPNHGPIHAAAATVRMMTPAAVSNARDETAVSGDGLVAAIVSAAPLFPEGRPPREKTQDYLPELQLRLLDARRAGPLSTDAVAVDQRPEAANPAKPVR